MFDVGGGKGKSGVSFMEFLVKRGYDVYSVDLRGTSESKKYGCKGASSLREYVEIDIPSTIRFIQSLGSHEKVYLVGHSLGGALSCAVASLMPNEIAGIVHLAGLYNPRVPVLSILNILVNSAYPSPWLPYSMEDPWGLLEISVESPTIGVTLSVAKAGLHTEMYNSWVLRGSTMRNEFLSQEEKEFRSNSIEDSLKNIKENVKKTGGNERDFGRILVSEIGKNSSIEQAEPSKSKSNVKKIIETVDDSKAFRWLAGWDELQPYLQKFEILQQLPLFFCYANADAILKPRDSIAGYARSKSRWRDMIRYVDEAEKMKTNLIISEKRKPIEFMSDNFQKNQTKQENPEPASDESEKMIQGQILNIRRSSSHTTISSMSSTTISAVGNSKEPSGLPDYSIPSSMTYGHCDILAGKNAEEIWDRIGTWLDATSLREQEWRFSRRYSAK
ncbi:hypothetical protein HK096_005873 [Nowakowskiella sp. JEL0078]|nr:hypothetical protein HK096_005873 [Nowakowskiella sp. JEL0078]